MARSTDGLEIERRYLLASPPPVDTLARDSIAIYELKQVYLRSEKNVSLRVRERHNLIDGSTDHAQTRKERISPLVRREQESSIDGETFRSLVAEQADPSRATIHKRRYVFDWQGQRFELDAFTDIPGLYILEIELDDESAPVFLPPFLEIERELTPEVSYTSRKLAALLAERAGALTVEELAEIFPADRQLSLSH